MPKRHNDVNYDEPPNKKSFPLYPEYKNISAIEIGEIITDLHGEKWKLGKRIGIGGFGVIHEVSQVNSRCKKSNEYVAKIESHGSGPLFSEINCYLRIGKKEMIEEWMSSKKISSLGMPNYVASGSHTFKENKFRFLIIPKYEEDLELILHKKKTFNLKTVLLISSQILRTLEYIHSKNYIHSDIKASNIMLKNINVKIQNKPEKLSNYSKSPVSDSKFIHFRLCKGRKLFTSTNRRYTIRSNKKINYNEDLNDISIELLEEPPQTKIKTQQLYLLDFGLSSKYKLSTGEPKKFEDQRKAHAGTLLFCSRDAHKGIQSRRSDLESLAFNMVYWLTGSLPWINDLENPELIERKKRHSFNDIVGFLCYCTSNPPKILKDFFQYINAMAVEDTPDYAKCQEFIKMALEEHGYLDENFDFDNLEGWKLKSEKVPKYVKLNEFKRPPLLSNMPIKPVLRKKIQKKSTQKKAALKWWKMLSNPEVLLKKGRHHKTSEVREVSPTTTPLNINELNPTPAMLEVFQRLQERKGQSPNWHDNLDSEGAPEGYTPAMIVIWKKMNEEKALKLKHDQTAARKLKTSKNCPVRILRPRRVTWKQKYSS